MALFPEKASVELDLPASAVFARWRVLLPYLPLAFALVAAAAMYWPSLNSAFVSDDYVYLSSVKQLSFMHYARVSVVPHTSDATFFLPRDFWRPFYFLSFEATSRLFGGHVVLYHLLNLGIHFASVLLVWRLARRLTARAAAANIAAVIFAVHPAGFESITWVSSVNSGGLPLALGSWLAFMNAVEKPPEVQLRWLAASVALLAVAVMFRETAFVVLPALVLWYVLVARREAWRRLRTYAPLMPFAAMLFVYSLLRTRFLTVPAGNSATYDLSLVPAQTWYYVKLGLSPFRDANVGWHIAVSRTAGVVVLATVPAALLFRRWLLFALVIAFVVSCLPYSAATLGVSSRYFYFPAAVLALAAGAAGVEVFDFCKRRSAGFAHAAGGAALLVALIGGGYAGNSRVGSWVGDTPDVSEAWVGQLQTTYPKLPDGGTLYTTNTPFILALFDSANLPPTVHYYYPNVSHVVRFEPQDLAKVQASLGPNDRIFVYRLP